MHAAVQHGGDTDPRTEALGISGNSQRCLGRGLHQQVIDHALVLVGDVTQLARQRIDDVKVRYNCSPEHLYRYVLSPLMFCAKQRGYPGRTNVPASQNINLFGRSNPLFLTLKDVRRVRPAIQSPRIPSATSIGAAPGRTIALSSILSGVR